MVTCDSQLRRLCIGAFLLLQQSWSVYLILTSYFSAKFPCVDLPCISRYFGSQLTLSGMLV